MLPLSLSVYIAGNFIHTVSPGHLSLESWHGVFLEPVPVVVTLMAVRPPGRFVNRKSSALSVTPGSAYSITWASSSTGGNKDPYLTLFRLEGIQILLADQMSGWITNSKIALLTMTYAGSKGLGDWSTAERITMINLTSLYVIFNSPCKPSVWLHRGLGHKRPVGYCVLKTVVGLGNGTGRRVVV